MGCFPLFTGQTKTRDLKNRGFARTCKVGFKKVVLTFGASHTSNLAVVVSLPRFF